MKITNINLNNLQELKEIIRCGKKLIFTGSQTSTVIPFDVLSEYLEKNNILYNTSINEIYLINSCNLHNKIEMTENQSVIIQGPVTWDELKNHLAPYNLDVFFNPTDTSAQVLSSLATSATGERCFAFTNLRQLVEEIQYIDYKGELQILSNENITQLFTPEESLILKQYQQDTLEYLNFKNPPFPAMNKCTDLMIGTEGQLGYIYKATLQVKKSSQYSYLILSLNDCPQKASSLQQVINSINLLRKKIISCEYIDKNCQPYLKNCDLPEGLHHKNLILLEIEESSIPQLLETLQKLNTIIPENNIFQISQKKFNTLRLEVPRRINEYLSKEHLIKRATDAQLSLDQLKDHISFFQLYSKKFHKTALFGHIGDNHLHFNVIDQSSNQELDIFFDDFYKFVKLKKGNPFAEHGIGLIKKPYIKKFYGKNQYQFFKILKKKFDPLNQFFPLGYMSNDSK